MRSRRLDAVLDPLLDAPELAQVLALKASRRGRALVAKGVRWLDRQIEANGRRFRSSPLVLTSGVAQLAVPPEERAEPGGQPPVASGAPARFLLYRIIGNDLYPRHDAGQSEANLRFILEHEPTLEGCEKRWLLNRIRQPQKVARLQELLERHGFGYDVIPFDQQAFQSQMWDWKVLPAPDFLASEAYRQLLQHQRQGWELALYRHKNNYLMHNNGARNRALELGAERAEWILPWDGNCFLTTAGWLELRRAVAAAPPGAAYFHVPMQRVGDNAHLLDPAFQPDPRDEPQLVFAAHAAERFDPAFPYGRRPKVELFWRLGLAGPWDGWPDEPWDQPRRPPVQPAPLCLRAGWVARLHSGVRDEGGRASTAVLSQQSRYSARNRAIKASINQALRPVDAPWCASAFARHWSQPLEDAAQDAAQASQAASARILLKAWWRWWERGGAPPAAAPEQLISAFCHLVWRGLLEDPAASGTTDLIGPLGSLWFAPGPTALQPRLRLLGRPQAPGRLPGTAPTMAMVLQLALLSDLLAWWGSVAAAVSAAAEWRAAFEAWRDALSDHLQGLISPAWLGERELDQQRLQLALALLQRHRGRPTEPVDALLRLLSRHHPGGRNRSAGAHPSLRQLALALAEQHGLLDPGLTRELGWIPGQDAIPPLQPLPVVLRP